MKSNRIMKIFEQYVRKYDMNNINIKAKYFHSLKVMEIASELASGLSFFSEEDVALCEFIALFHEIGSFSKTPDYHVDGDNEDSYEKTIDVLFNKKLIREVTKDKKYDDIVKIAIYAYEKNGFPRGIDDKTRHICAIIKDAHNLESFRIFVNYPYVDTRIDSYPNSLIYEDFKKFKAISPRMSESSADTVLIVLSKINSFNYLYSYYLLKEKNYINRMYELLTFDNDDIKKFFKQITKIYNNRVEEKISSLKAIQ